ncbi:MAG: riboflavin synthase [Candidatus Gastranaerophilales bacterium]|nr:riboflavin synthase [Candidatus Gastranaerophilales bacterium]
MFTGIIEEVGTIKSVNCTSSGAKIVVSCAKVLEETKIGDSIGIDGVCQTVTDLSSNSFSVETMNETLSLTTFETFKTGQKVNLERAAALSTRLGGHLLSGHVEGLVKITAIEKQGIADIFRFKVAKNIERYMIYKGSVALNGVSLTICSLEGGFFEVSLIPHTKENTTFQYLKIGDFVNIETDIIAKYIEKLMIKDNNTSSRIDENFLKENGFF